MMTLTNKEAVMNNLSIKYNDGELILDNDSCMCAIGDTAHKAMSRINTVLNKKRADQAKYNLLSDDDIEASLSKAIREIFEGVNNCTIILGVA